MLGTATVMGKACTLASWGTVPPRTMGFTSCSRRSSTTASTSGPDTKDTLRRQHTKPENMQGTKGHSLPGTSVDGHIRHQRRKDHLNRTLSLPPESASDVSNPTAQKLLPTGGATCRRKDSAEVRNSKSVGTVDLSRWKDVAHVGLAERAASINSRRKDDAEVGNAQSAGSVALSGIRDPANFGDTRSVSSIASSRRRTVKISHNRLSMQTNLLQQVLCADDDMLVKAESANLDRVLSELADANSRLIDILGDEEKEIDQSDWMEKVDAEAFALKQ